MDTNKHEDEPATSGNPAPENLKAAPAIVTTNSSCAVMPGVRESAFWHDNWKRVAFDSLKGLVALDAAGGLIMFVPLHAIVSIVPTNIEPDGRQQGGVYNLKKHEIGEARND